ncbi:MAG TPA: ATP-dependent Clp protease adaptor ClpS [Tepidisphaeraceae bacterium]|jgi:ATP-dependent Clp protease adaptor protein ClpS
MSLVSTEQAGTATVEPEKQVTPAAPAPAERKRTRPSTDARPKRQPPHAVILHNDPVNGFGYVVGVLRRIFRYGTARAFTLTLRAHLTGRAAVWTGPLEVAELKADQLRSAGPDPNMVRRGAGPLGVSVEPLPG